MPWAGVEGHHENLEQLSPKKILFPTVLSYKDKRAEGRCAATQTLCLASLEVQFILPKCALWKFGGTILSLASGK